MRQLDIAQQLMGMGFEQQSQKDGYLRYQHPRMQGKKGSLYVKNNYVSATGTYRKALEQRVVASGDDGKKGNPVWQDGALANLLIALPATLDTY